MIKRASALIAGLLAAILATLLGPVSAQAAGWPLVSQGSKGKDVTTVQYLLTQQGYPTAADGDFGGGTADKVKEFQRGHGLDADGKVGGGTWPKLIVQVAKGAKNDAVKAVQVQLNSYGNHLAVDGDFGGGTEDAVKAFQHGHSLDADGVVGPATWLSLVSGSGGGGSTGGSDRASLARQVFDSSRISTLPFHVGGTDAASTPRQNIVDTMNGRPARTSPWGDKGVSEVWLNTDMLTGMVKLANESGYSFRVTEIVGGKHTPTSLHYAGRAFDVDLINGQPVGGGAPYRAFEAACRAYGATEVLGPGYPGHDTHVHCGWK